MKRTVWVWVVLVGLGVGLTAWLQRGRKEAAEDSREPPSAGGPAAGARVAGAGRAVGPPPPLSSGRVAAGPGGGRGSGPVSNGDPSDVIPNQYVLSFFNEHDRSAFIKLARARGFTVLGISDLGYAIRLLIPDEGRFRALLREGPTPLDASANFFVRAPPEPPGDASGPPSGPYAGFGSQALAWLGVGIPDPSWGSGVTIAILDSGIAAHPSLAQANIVRLGTPPADVDPAVAGHGTAVASLLAGASAEVKGMAPGARILDVPVLLADGVGDAFTLAQRMVEAVNAGANVINLCVGTYGDSVVLRQAVSYALDRGVAVVAAAGNDGVQGVLYPAAYDGVVTVAAVDASGRHVYFSNRGASVDLAAPGVGVSAAWPGESAVAFSGTSASTPFVTGAVAALLSQNPGMKGVEAADILCRYGDDAGMPGKDEELGYGIVDPTRAMNRNVAGIYDVAVGVPYVRQREEKSEVEVLVYAQNRGTEPLGNVRIEVAIDGETETVDFTDVAVGQTVTHSVRLGEGLIDDQAGVRVRCSAAIRGADDATPLNNVSEVVLLPAESGEEGR